MKDASNREEWKKHFLTTKGMKGNPMSISSDDYEHGMHFGCSRQPIQDHINFTLVLGSYFSVFFNLDEQEHRRHQQQQQSKKIIMNFCCFMNIARVNRIMAGWMVYVICLILHMAKRATKSIHCERLWVKSEYSRTKATICCYFIRRMNDERIPDEREKGKKTSPYDRVLWLKP